MLPRDGRSWPFREVRVDGRPVRAEERISQWNRVLTFPWPIGEPGSWSDGMHEVEVELVDEVPGCDQHVGLRNLAFRGARINPHRTPTCARSVLVERLAFNGAI